VSARRVCEVSCLRGIIVPRRCTCAGQQAGAGAGAAQQLQSRASARAPCDKSVCATKDLECARATSRREQLVRSLDERPKLRCTTLEQARDEPTNPLARHLDMARLVARLCDKASMVSRLAWYKEVKSAPSCVAPVAGLLCGVDETCRTPPAHCPAPPLTRALSRQRTR
jgi:hypothetical protein